MKKEKFLNWLFILSVLVSGLSFASCSDDDNDSNDDITPPVVDVPNPAGDDFYMFVNGDWHESLTDLKESQGYDVDMNNVLEEYTDDACEQLEEYQMVMQSLENLEADTSDLNLIRMVLFTNSIISEIETVEDAYIAIGKCIGMGLMQNDLKLYMAHDEGKIRYTFGPLLFEMGEGENANIHKRIRTRKYTKYVPKTRGGEDIVGAILEGLDMDPEYFGYEEELMGETLEKISEMSLEELKEYIKENIYNELAPYCGDELVSEITLGTVTSTAEYLMSVRDQLFTYSIAYAFKQLYITEDIKEQFEDYVAELKGVFANRITNNTWLSEQTKQEALFKLEKMKFFYGGPDEWLEAGFPEPKGELLVDDILEVKASRTRLIKALLDTDLDDASMTYIMYSPDGEPLNQHNAVYMPDNNSVNIFPSYMMAPEWTVDMDPAEMYATFYVIGHEMTHGFDKDGSTFDAYGQENDWWTAEDREKFLALNDQLSAQISTFDAAPGIKANGENTVAEDVADLGGVNIALDALTEYMKKNGVTGEELKEAQKKLFERYAFRYRKHYSEEEIPEYLADVHSMNTIRVNGIFQHIDAWYELYDVVEGDSLYLPEEERVVIW